MINEKIENKYQSDEIDLVELIKVLWDKKWWIVLSTFVCTSLAGLYAFTAKEQWTSKTEIIAPQIADLDSYLILRKEYARILGTEFDIYALANGLYGKFERLAYSLDEREAFLLNSEVYKQLSEGKNEAAKRSLLSTLARENISIIKPDHKKQSDVIGRQYTFSAESAQLAQKSLSDFINYINKKVLEVELSEFLLLATEKINDLTFEHSKIKTDLNIYKTVQLDNLSKAYDMARQAGIKEYSKILIDGVPSEQNVVVTNDAKVSLSDSKLGDNSYLFMLGEKYLQAQINVIEQKHIIYPPRYYQLEEYLKNLVPLLDKIKTAKANSFTYLSSPDYPIAKDKPKKVLILAIGIILGLFLSSFIVVIMSLFRKNSYEKSRYYSS